MSDLYPQIRLICGGFGASVECISIYDNVLFMLPLGAANFSNLINRRFNICLGVNGTLPLCLIIKIK